MIGQDEKVLHMKKLMIDAIYNSIFHSLLSTLIYLVSSKDRT